MRCKLVGKVSCPSPQSHRVTTQSKQQDSARKKILPIVPNLYNDLSSSSPCTIFYFCPLGFTFWTVCCHSFIQYLHALRWNYSNVLIPKPLNVSVALVLHHGVRSWLKQSFNRLSICNVDLLGKAEGRRPLGRPRRRWVDNISMDIQEVGCGYMDWIGLAQDRQVADACECGNEHSGCVKCGEFLD